MAQHRSKKGCKTNSVLDWWQTVLDETKDLMDDTIDRVRGDDGDDDDDDALADEVRDLKKAVADLNAKMDRLIAERNK